MASIRVLRVLGLASVATAASEFGGRLECHIRPRSMVTNCGGAHDHLSDVSINLVPDPISRTTPFTLTLSGTLDEDLTGGELDVSLEVRALRVIDKAVNAKTSYSLSPGVAKGPMKIVIGPVTLPQDPGEALLKGQVSVKNTKGEPVACIAVDIEVPLAETPLTQQEEMPPVMEQNTFCNKPTDHLKNASETQTGEVTQLSGTLDEDLDSIVAHVNLDVKALFVKLPLKLSVPVSFSPALPKGDWKLSFHELSAKQREVLGSPVKVEGQIVVDDSKNEEVLCVEVASSQVRDAEVIV
ncbi:unnamed protein product [Symbiodinium natans]|uniref:MD-2-related lipid-recognition domain-containing protein n=1 Tax=Symbiodinium natans TaxID=878477 RepID=A0A812NDT2_9DINO|nr:unnamed protein product [Symbiodinium natans]